MSYTVSAVSSMSGVTVRTLHHYDELGLLSPATRSSGGYRLYDDADLERLQTLLFYRELGFSLSEIAELMSMPGFSRRQALVDQHTLLVEKRDRIDRMLAAVEAALIAEDQGVEMTKDDLMSPFGDFDPKEYEEEAKRRWGDTDAYKESIRRTSSYADSDWTEIRSESEAIAEALADLLRSGAGPEEEAAMDIAEGHRRHIHDRFYPCSPEMHNNLGEMYVVDPRFTEYWDKREPGLAVFVRDAIAANAIRQL